MNKNIFEGAKFGDKFQTVDGQMAILIFPHYYQNTTVKLCIEDGDEFDVYLDGQVDTRFWNDNLSIEGKWKESIDEDKLAEDYIKGVEVSLQLNESYSLYNYQKMKESFKAGYNKANEV